VPSPFGLFGGSHADGSPTIEFLPPDDRAFAPSASDPGGGRRGTGITFVGLDGGRDGERNRDGDRDEWGDIDGADGAGRAPRSRWALALAGLAVIGLLVGGVVAAAPWSDDETTTAPTTTTPTNSNTAEPSPARPAPPSPPVAPFTTAVDAPVPGVEGWLLDPPVAGLTARALIDGAAEDDGVRRDAVESGGWGEVWATDGATRTSGRWFSLTLLPFVELEPVAPGWIATEIDGRQGRAATDGDGVVRIQFERGETDAARLVAIEGFGFSLPQLFELAASVGIIDDRPQLADDRPQFTRPELIDGLRQVAGRSSDVDLVDAALVGGPIVSGVYYRGPASDDVTLLQRRQAGEVSPVLARLAFTPVMSAIDPTTAFTGFVPDEFVVGARTIDGIDVSVVRWVIGDDDVWLLTTLSSGVLPAMLDDARRVSPDEWAERRDATIRTPALDLGPQSGAAPEIVIGEGVVSGTVDWSLTVRPLAGRVTLTSAALGDVETSLAAVVGTGANGTNPSIGTIAIGDSTLVIAASAIDAASLRIRLPNGTERTVELTALPTVDDPPTEPGRLDPSFWTSWSGASVGVVALGPEEVTAGGFVAEIIAPDGTVTATFDAWGAVDDR